MTRQWVPPTPDELSRLLPQYQIESILGRGGMGVVYKGFQVNLRRPVAIKLLPAELAEDESFTARFQREAYTLAGLQHPGIIAIYDSGQTSQGHLYFVMEYVDGSDLAQVIRDVGLEPRQAMGLVLQICDALHYAHARGVIHRDIKPANVLLTRDGRVKLADFGLARPADTAGMTMLTATHVVMGTPDYMAPEQGMGICDQRSDIYALGIMLYQMLTGQVPKGHFAMPSAFGRGDARLDAVVSKAIQQFPEHRFQDVSEVKTAVEQWQIIPVQKPVEAAPVPQNSLRARKQPDLRKLPSSSVPPRRPLAAYVTLSALLLLGGWGIWHFTQSGSVGSVAKAEPPATTPPEPAAANLATSTPAAVTSTTAPAATTGAVAVNSPPPAPMVQTRPPATPVTPAPSATPAASVSKPATPPPTSPELEMLKTQYLAAIEKQVTPAVDAYAKSLIPSYANALDRESKASGISAGDKAALAAELSRLSTSATVPSKDDPGLLPSIATLRNTYRTAVDSFRADKLAPLKSIYDQQVKELANKARLDAEGFALILEGDSHEGWETVGDGGMLVQEGVATLWRGKSEACLWYARQTFSDFILRMDFRITSRGGNSGVYVRFPDPEGIWKRVVDSSYQIDVSDEPAGMEATGAICGIKSPFAIPQRAGEWNELEIEARGQRYQVRVNGTLVNDFSGSRLTEGYIGLQGFRPTGVQFRRIRIKDLKAPERGKAASLISPPPAATPEPPVAASAQPTSIKGVNTFSGHRYQYVSGSVSWKTARERAESMGGHLVTITSEAENRWLTATYSRLLDEKSENIWLGAIQESPTSGWHWVTGEPFTFTAWAPGEPNNVRGGGGAAGYPFMLNLIRQKGVVGWNDSSIDISQKRNSSGFIVEWDTQ